MLKYINNSFDDDVVKNEKLVLVDFYADWCGPCQLLGPILENIAKKDDRFDIVKINVDENEKISYEYKIMYIPTMLIFKNGEVVDRLDGLKDENEILDLLNKYL